MNTQTETNNPTSEADQEKWAEKITKLLTKAEGAATEEEGAAFFAKAFELMAKWQIDSAMLAASGKGPNDEIITRVINLKTTFRRQDVQMASAIAPAMNIRIYISTYRPGTAAKVYFVGFETDVDRAEMLFHSLLIQVAVEQGRATIVGDPRPFKKSFRTAYASRVRARFNEQQTANTKKREHTKEVGLVLVERKALVDEYFGNLGLASARGGNAGFNAAGHAAGTSAGNRADLGTSRINSRKALTK